MKTRRAALTRIGLMAVIATVLVLGLGTFKLYRSYARPLFDKLALVRTTGSSGALRPGYDPRLPGLDPSGFAVVPSVITPWKPEASLEEISRIWRGAGYRGIEEIDRRLAVGDRSEEARLSLLIRKVSLLNYEGEAEKSYQLLEQIRSTVVSDEARAVRSLASVIYLQGVTALRRGENDNCVMCRGESSCILPISSSAVHVNPTGSRLAIKHFTEYLNQFPDDLEVRWLLNLAHMTLGEYPEQVDPRFRLDLSRFFNSEFDIGRFRDVGHLVGVNRFNQSGGAIMEDFDNDGLLDIAVTSFDATQSMAIYRNKGDATFEDHSQEAGVTNQLGGLVCYQADYDNDGRMDIFICAGPGFRWRLGPRCCETTAPAALPTSPRRRG